MLDDKHLQQQLEAEADKDAPSQEVKSDTTSQSWETISKLQHAENRSGFYASVDPLRPQWSRFFPPTVTGRLNPAAPVYVPKQ